MNTLVNASRQTWITSFPYDLFYFVGRIDKHSHNFSFKSNIIELSTDDNEYPPVNKTFHMWTYFFKKHISHYDYFMAVDADTYVNVGNLRTMFNKLKCKDCYVGHPATGEPYERNRLGLQAPYCLGMGYVIARNTLHQFGSYIDICRRSTVAKHSDTEMGRCIYKFTSGISCTPAPMPLERVMYTINKQGVISRFEHNLRNQLQIEFPKSPPTRFFLAVLVHPLKTSSAFHQFHRQTTLQLRPVLPPAFLNDSCVANPVIQNETYPQNLSVPECRLRTSTQSFYNSSSLSAFAITLPGYNQRLQRTIEKFRKHHIHLQPFYGVCNVSAPKSANMTHGEWNLRLTMIRLIQMLIKAKLKLVLIVEDDAIPHRNFSQLLQGLIHDHRCKECVSGGLLMLGSTTWPAGWKTLDGYNKIEKGMCRNICTETYGSFAVLLHQATFEPILAWLKTKIMPQPYDYVFAYLARLGYPVRVALPNLIISDIRHTSAIRPRIGNSRFHNLTLRAIIHRWKIENYMISMSDDIF